MRKIFSAVAVVFVLAGCGASDDESKPSNTDAPSESSAPVEQKQSDGSPEADVPAQDVAADTQAAEAALLGLSDFPAGWSEVPDEEDDSNEELQDRVRECLGPDAADLLSGEAKALTGDFTDPDDSTVSHTVQLAPTEELAAAYTAGGSSGGVAECLTALYREAIPVLLTADEEAEDVEVGDITVGALNVGKIGDDGFAYRVTAPLRIEGFSIDLVVDLVAVRVGRSVAGLTFQSTFSSRPIEQITEYTTLAASRLPG